MSVIAKIFLQKYSICINYMGRHCLIMPVLCHKNKVFVPKMRVSREMINILIFKLFFGEIFYILESSDYTDEGTNRRSSEKYGKRFEKGNA